MNKSILISIIEFVIFLGIIVWGYNKMNNKLDVSEQNLKAYKNQAKNLELENGELIRVRDSYILEIDQLQEEFNVSKREVKDLQKKLNSSLAYISKMESNIRIDTINNVKDSIIYIDSTKTNIYFKYTFKYPFLYTGTFGSSLTTINLLALPFSSINFPSLQTNIGLALEDF